MRNPARGKEQPQVLVQAGGSLAPLHCRKGHEGPGGQEAEYESAVSSCSNARVSPIGQGKGFISPWHS